MSRLKHLEDLGPVGQGKRAWALGLGWARLWEALGISRLWDLRSRNEEVPAKLRSRPLASTIAPRPARKPKPQKPAATVPRKGKAGGAETREGASAFREASRRALDWHSYRGVGLRCPEALGGGGGG